MTQVVLVEDVPEKLEELLLKVSQGETLLIARHGREIAALGPVLDQNQDRPEVAGSRSSSSLIEKILQRRDSGAIARVSADEIRAWKSEGLR